MKKASKVLAAGMGSALMVAGAVQGIALAQGGAAQLEGNVDQAGAQVADEVGAQVADAQLVQEDQVVGTFGYTQEEVSSNDWLVKHIGESSKYLCGSQTVAVGNESGAADAEDWVLEVTGDVANPYQATIGELAESGTVQSVLMGCSCAGNPTDGLSVANALVEGIPTILLLEMAQPDEGVNTIVFTSADGYEMALPYDYVTSRYCPLVFNVNGSALIESVGGTNQLWLGSTPGNYFARDVVSIRLETRDEAPADPASDEARAAYENLPNIGVKFGGEVA